MFFSINFSVYLCSVFLLLCLFIFHRKYYYTNTVSGIYFESSLVLLLAVAFFQAIRDFHFNDLSYLMCTCFSAFFIFSYIYVLHDYVSMKLEGEVLRVSYVLRSFLLVLLIVLLFFGIKIDNFLSLYVFLFCISFSVVFYLSLRSFFYASNINFGFRSFFVLMPILFLSAVLFDWIFGLDFYIFIWSILSLWLFYTSEEPNIRLDVTSGFFSFVAIYDHLVHFAGQKIYLGAVYTRLMKLDSSFVYHFFKESDIRCFKYDDHCYYFLSDNKELLMDFLQRLHDIYSFVIIVCDDVTSDKLPVFVEYVNERAELLEISKIHLFTKDIFDHLQHEKVVKSEIVDAIRDDRIELFIQPIFDVSLKRFVSGECLCRMRSKDGRILSPDYFIPIAEKTGLIIDIETVMFRKMCQCLSDFRIKSSDIRYFEINLSVKKGEQKSLFAEYSKILSEFGVSSDQVNLEITETDSLEEKESIIMNMYSMCSVGFSFSLDDFGSGESNIGYMIDMPVSVIKFDKDLISKACISKRAEIIISTLMRMAHELGMKVVAEGIETKDDFDLAVSMGADFIQGFYFSKPLPFEEFITFIQSYAKDHG